MSFSWICIYGFSVINYFLNKWLQLKKVNYLHYLPNNKFRLENSVTKFWILLTECYNILRPISCNVFYRLFLKWSVQNLTSYLRWEWLFISFSFFLRSIRVRLKPTAVQHLDCFFIKPHQCDQKKIAKCL